ncbi:S8 family serine peptidase [Planococcus salinarum]|uniref:S8 family serine peptidase n=1 Tax=Planococcus salinarum TaxID=622695 RepID=UPI0028C41C53|nr:S8 family serine peptidase [Planococcus salinarum]
MNKFRKALVTMLVVMMTLSSAVFGLTGVSAATNKSLSDLPTLNEEKPAVKVPEKFVNPEDPSKTVRVIVELEKAPTIETATQQGVLYKDLPASEKANLEAAVESDQATIQSAVTKAAPSVTYLENFTTVFNGFSAEVAVGQVEKIADLAGVKKVYEATEYTRPSVQPEMKYSKELVQAQQAWGEYGYKGEGMVVGVIDTGIDPSHKDMVLTDDSTGEVTKEELAALLADGSIENGEYFTAKVPFGWNYMDDNNQILDLGPEASMHGMHVAGTVGANGDEEAANPGLKGVAPEAQLLALKVFGNDPQFASTYGDIYVKAIDDSIKLGADVINMSLGSVSGFVDSTNPEQMAVERSTENGILVAISAGNSDMFGSGTWYPYAENQDYGLTGSPSVSEDSFGVASFENNIVTGLSFNYHVNGVEAGQAMYLLANDADPRDLPNATYDVEFAGFGNAADFEGKDFTGKFALVSRGEIAFTSKGLNAQAAGAAGVIIYNNTTGTINMQSDAAIKIPYMSALQEDGVAMKEQLDLGNKVSVSFEGDYIETKNPAAGEMSDFTSWGPTPNLDFKPEITAPGGNIFSTLNDDQYGLMSGTSMAAPHVAGGTALVFQRVDADFGLTGAERVQFAKNLMMNTAKTVELAEGEFVSPRRQGAGLMQLHDALSTDVMVTNNATGEAKVALKEIENDQYSFTLTAQNFSDEDAEFAVDVNVQVDTPVNGGPNFVTVPNLYGSQVITEDVSIAAPSTVTVPANGTVEIPVAVDISAVSVDLETVYVNGFFVDGFVTLTDVNEEITGNTSLVVPYFGFNGGWDDASIFDYFAWEELSFYEDTLLTDGEGYVLNGGTHLEEGVFDTEKFAFSPNGDGSVDSVIPVYSLIRNAKEFEVNILNEAGTVIRTIRTAENLTKHYSGTSSFTYNPDLAWDGKALGKTVADGDYQIQLSAVIDYPNAEWQSIEFPITVDTVAPEGTATFNAATKTVEVTEFADNTGVDRWEVYLNGEELTENAETDADESLAPTTTEFAVTADITKTDELVAVFYDVAGNSTEVELRVTAEESTHPVIFIETPEVTETFDTNEVTVAGTVEDDSNVVSVTVNGEEADSFDGVNFEHTLTFEDGVHDVKVKAVDEFDNEMEIRRQIFVDTTAAAVEVVEAPESVDLDTTEAEVTVNVQDNFDEIAVYVNDSEVYRKGITEPYAMVAFDKDITFTVPVLEDGQNDYVVLVVDAAGHETELEFSIFKEAAEVVTFSDIQGHWAQQYIEDLATFGIIKGKTPELFAPEADLTRAEYAVLLVRTLNLDLTEKEGTFKDANNHWAVKYIEAAARAGIVLGNPDGTFNPDAAISRQDTAVMAIRAVEYQDASLLEGLEGTHEYVDQAKVSTYAEEAVAQAYALGLMIGDQKNVFAPKEEITRAETAVVIHRALTLMDLWY